MARKGAVEIPYLAAGQALPAAGMDVHIRIRPLVGGIRIPRPVPEAAHASRRGDLKDVRRRLLRVVMGEPAPIGPWDDDEPAGPYPGAFDEEHGGHVPRGFVGVCAAEHEDHAARDA